MAIKRVCDFCDKDVKKEAGFLVDFSFNENGRDACLSCYNKREEERQAAYDAVPDNVEELEAPLGYWFYVEDELLFPLYLQDAPGKEKIEFMYKQTGPRYSIMQ